ncbi:hypothetical protein ACFQU2_37055 [Siccirubricoccus deserti]
MRAAVRPADPALAVEDDTARLSPTLSRRRSAASMAICGMSPASRDWITLAASIVRAILSPSPEKATPPDPLSA